MNNKYEDLLYRSGLTASGCWDEMDGYAHDAIIRLIKFTIKDCAILVNVFSECQIPASTYPQLLLQQYDLS
jgi:hypothetical protein